MSLSRQQKRKFERRLKLPGKEIDNMAEMFRRENEEKNRAVVIEFLALTIEALRLEFGFGQKRIDQISLKPMDIVRISDEVKKEKRQKLAVLRN